MIAETRKKTAAKKVKAISALNLEHSDVPVIPCQFHTLPQFMGPMYCTFVSKKVKGAWEATRTLVSKAKATMNRMKRTRSAGQWRKLPANGKRKRSEKRMPIAATTSV
jgi:hypothetical protein